MITIHCVIVVGFYCVLSNYSESNAARATGQGGVAVLLNMFDDWHRVDTKNRHVSLRKAILTCLKHITNLRM